MLGRVANAVFGKFGFELRRKAVPIADRGCHLEILRNARRNGLEPKTIIDVGAAIGTFTRAASQVFVDKDFLLIEPLDEYGHSLQALIDGFGGRAQWIKAVAASEAGTTILNVHEDLVGSSTLQEAERGVDGVPRNVPAIKIDDEVSSRGLRPPYVLKVDVQGSELSVLDGAQRVLGASDFVILEISFFDFFRGGSSVSDVVAYMAKRDFVPYDLTSPLYRPFDGALAQIDICFAKKTGVLRRSHVYATAEQRRAQNEVIRAELARRIGNPGRSDS